MSGMGRFGLRGKKALPWSRLQIQFSRYAEVQRGTIFYRRQCGIFGFMFPPLLHFGVIFSAAEIMWLMPVLWEHTSVALRAVGSKQKVLLFPLRCI